MSSKYTLATGAVAAYCVWRLFRRNNELDRIPTYGIHHGPFGIWHDAFRFVSNAREVLQEGYHKHYGSIFKIPLPDRWMVVVTTPELINEVRQAKSSDLSLSELLGDVMGAKHYIVGPEMATNPYHIDVVRSPLTRNMNARLDDVYDEIVASFEELFPKKAGEWKCIKPIPVVRDIVCRTSERLFVGLPLCRDPDWIDLNVHYTEKTFVAGLILMLFPEVLKPIVGWLISPLSDSVRRGKRHLEKVILERIEQDDAYGTKYEGRPNDLISWLLEHAKGEERTVEFIIRRVLLIGLASIATSTEVFTQALFNLAAHPEYMEPMREEVRAAIKQGGWTKQALTKMRKVDSFLKESVRDEGIAPTGIERMVTNPAGYTFSNGVHVPYGTYVAAPLVAIHHEERKYNSPTEFNGFRFSDMRDESDKEGTRHQLVATSLDYLSFGHGRYACPGRFFAASEMKLMLAHFVLNYDVALEGDTKPEVLRQAIAVNVNPEAKILIKRLQS